MKLREVSSSTLLNPASLALYHVLYITYTPTLPYISPHQIICSTL